MKTKSQNGKHVGQQLILIFLVLILGLLLFALGLMIGYGVIGDGESMWSILSPDKWQELIGKFTGK